MKHESPSTKNPSHRLSLNIKGLVFCISTVSVRLAGLQQRNVIGLAAAECQDHRGFVAIAIFDLPNRLLFGIILIIKAFSTIIQLLAGNLSAAAGRLSTSASLGTENV